MLTEQEKKYLLEKARLYNDSEEWDKAIRCYDELSKDDPTNPYYYSCIAGIYLGKQETDAAIIYVNKAIDLCPDDSSAYSTRGACYAQWLNCHRNIGEKKKKEVAAKIIADYQTALDKNPTDASAWLAKLERHVVDCDWDDAIGCYGECSPYIKTEKDQSVRAWLGCLAKVLYGDAVEKRDEQPLFDDTIRLKGGKGHTWCVTEIENLLTELEHEGEIQENGSRASKYHEKFLSHFDGEPWRDISS